MVAKIKSDHAVGKRKTAIARVYMQPGSGKFNINGREIENYLIRATSRMVVMQPLEITGNVDKYDIYARVVGGGLSGQSDAIRHGIAKILSEKSPEFRTMLKAQGLITRDARRKERKMYGLRSSRARYQFSKR